MLYTERELGSGNAIYFPANRLQFMTNEEKRNTSTDMLDRGIFSINDVRELWNLPPIEGGDVRIIRGEYYNADEKVSEEVTPDENGETNPTDGTQGA